MLKTIINSVKKKRSYLLLTFVIITLAVSFIIYSVLLSFQARIIEHQALRIAESITDQAVTSRDVFSQAVADKLKQDGFGITEDFQTHKGFAPIPAQFMKFVAIEALVRSGGLYRYRVISKWNLEPSQGLKDDFEYWAWDKLEKQDQANPASPIRWKPVWRFEEKNGERTLRYMRADPASDNGCVSCHNDAEKKPEIKALRDKANVLSGKQWKLHQLMGAVQAEIPIGMVETVALQQAKITLIIVLLTAFSGLGIMGVLAWRNLKQEEATSLFFKQKANIDSLTGLGNRAAFETQVKMAINQARRTDTKIGILFIDLDGFKPVNDNYGHQAGDWLLQQVSIRFLKVLRDIDIIARQGGDEFLVMLQGVTDAQNFNIVAEKLIDVLEPEFDIQGKKVKVSASIGISHFPQHSTDLNSLIAKADAAMYVAKKNGKSTWREWDIKTDDIKN